MRIVAIGVLLLASASGVGAQQRYVPPDMVLYVDCLRAQARVLDDRVSDARTIATAMVTTCKAKRRDYLFKREPTSAAIARTYQPADTGEIDVATTVVLQGRTAPASKSAPSTPKAKGEAI